MLVVSEGIFPQPREALADDLHGPGAAEPVALRLRTAQEELAHIGQFQYRVINRDNCLDQAVAEIDAIITAEKCRVAPRLVQFL